MTTSLAADTDTRPLQRVPKELASSSGFLLARLGFTFKARVLAQLEQMGSDPHDYGVLAILGEGTRETQATIAEALALDPSRLVALLDSLEHRGLVVRQRDPQDRRRHMVSITAAGEQQLVRLRSLVRKLEDEFFASFDADTRATFHAQLSQLASLHDPRCALNPTSGANG